MSQHEALVLREVSDDVWLDFASGIRRATRPERTPGIHEHWKRSKDLGASFEGPSSEDHLLRGAELQSHVERTELVAHVADTDFERAATDVSVRAFVLLLADPTGVVVRASGGGQFEGEARRLRLIAGADWSEPIRGTNAIGTAIAEERPVFVRGNAHFARRFHDIVCYAAPIFDADGALVAVLDATSGFAGADDTVGQAVVRTAGAISQALRERALGRAGVAVTRTLARAVDRMEGIALLVEPPMNVARMNGGAKAMFGDRSGQPIEAVLGISMGALVAEGRKPRGLTIDAVGVSHSIRLDPIETAGGALIALLVYVEPEARAPRSSPRSKAPPPPPIPAFSSVFSRDPVLDEGLTWAHRIADSNVPVLLLAETGSGKELVARSIHAASRRASEPFVAVNCGAIAPSLLESELFGYGPSAFTGADRGGRHGLFAAAASGTLFLDEVAEMPLAMQAALLRVLEDGTYRRVGETTSQRSDVRIVSATCRDIGAMIEAGTFRRDLYYRLKGAEVTLPPLRERADLAELAAHVLDDLSRARGLARAPELSPDVITLFERYPWPGNVRELRTLLEVSLVLVGNGAVLHPEHLPPDFRRALTKAAGDSPGDAPPSDLDVAERSAVRRVLGEVDGNVSSAAKRLGVARSTLYRMMRRHGLLP